MSASVGGIARSWFGILGTSALLFGGGPEAQAETLVDFGTPDLTSGLEMSGWVVADDFSVGAQEGFDGFVLDGLTFWTLENTATAGFSGQFEWRILSDGGGAPGAVVASGDSTGLVRAATDASAYGLDEYENGFGLSTGVLSFDTSYWLAIHNGPTSGTDAVTADAGVYWETWDAFSGTAHVDAAPFAASWATPYDGGSVELAFRLSGVLVVVPDPSGVVPEPTKLMTLWGGLGALAYCRRRRA